jgi:hypothetical protein
MRPGRLPRSHFVLKVYLKYQRRLLVGQTVTCHLYVTLLSSDKIVPKDLK